MGQVKFGVRLMFSHRLDHWTGVIDYYYIEYSYQTFFGTQWTRLLKWKDAAVAWPDDACWAAVSLPMESAEALAKTIKSREDLDEYYKKEKAKETKWREDYQEYLKNRKPIIKEKTIL